MGAYLVAFYGGLAHAFSFTPCGKGYLHKLSQGRIVGASPKTIKRAQALFPSQQTLPAHPVVIDNPLQNLLEFCQEQGCEVEKEDLPKGIDDITNRGIEIGISPIRIVELFKIMVDAAFSEGISADFIFGHIRLLYHSFVIIGQAELEENPKGIADFFQGLAVLDPVFSGIIFEIASTGIAKKFTFESIEILLGTLGPRIGKSGGAQHYVERMQTREKRYQTLLRLVRFAHDTNSILATLKNQLNLKPK